MANDTVTLTLDGEVDLDDFAEAVFRFNRLIRAIARAENATHVRWRMAQLDVGSAVAAARGIPLNGASPDVAREEAERVVKGYLRTGLSLQHGEAVPYPPDVEREARELTGILNGRVQNLRFETAEAEATIGMSVEQEPLKLPVPMYGAVEGRVQTLTSRGGLRFTLYDTLYDKAVSCYLVEDFEDIMRDAWGRRAVVEGRVTRDIPSGRALAIRAITAVQVLPEIAAGRYRDLRGIAPSTRGVSAEDAIRRLRDAG